MDGNTASVVTDEHRKKAAKVTKYIENMYNAKMNVLVDRRQRRELLEEEMKSQGLSEQQRENILNELSRKETEYSRI